MSYCLKLKPRGKKRLKLYSVVIMNKKKGLGGNYKEKVGYIEPLVSGAKLVCLNRAKISLWLLRGVELRGKWKEYIERIL